MNLINNIDFYDFYFNGHYLSEFGGIVGGSEPLKQYPLLPNRTYITDKAADQDGVYVFGSYLEPRTFEVPVFFENIDEHGLRNIAAWLNSEEDQWFHYKDDDLKIKCSVDGEGTLETIAGLDGQTYIKFIAHDPYYYKLSEEQIIKTNLSGTSNEFLLTNIGNQKCFPTIKIIGSGDITVSILNTDKTITYSSCTITSVVSAVTLDSLYCNCLSGSGANWFDKFDGTFPLFPSGKFVLKIEGPISAVYISPNYRWI